MTQQEWLDHLRAAAVTRWGTERAAELESGFERMAGAISRLMAHSPVDSTTPRQAAEAGTAGSAHE